MTSPSPSSHDTAHPNTATLHGGYSLLANSDVKSPPATADLARENLLRVLDHGPMGNGHFSFIRSRITARVRTRTKSKNSLRVHAANVRVTFRSNSRGHNYESNISAVRYKNWKMYFAMVSDSPAGFVTGVIPYHWTQVVNVKRDPFETSIGQQIKTLMGVGG